MAVSSPSALFKILTNVENIQEENQRFDLMEKIFHQLQFDCFPEIDAAQEIFLKSSFAKVLKMMESVSDDRKRFALMDAVLPKIKLHMPSGDQFREMQSALTKSERAFAELKSVNQRAATPTEEKRAVPQQRELKAQNPKLATPKISDLRHRIFDCGSSLAKAVEKGSKLAGKGLHIAIEGMRKMNQRAVQPLISAAANRLHQLRNAPLVKIAEAEFRASVRSLADSAKRYLPFNSETWMSIEDGQIGFDKKAWIIRAVLLNEVPIFAAASILGRASLSSYRLDNSLIFYLTTAFFAVALPIADMLISFNSVCKKLDDAERISADVEAFIARPSSETAARIMKSEAAVFQLVRTIDKEFLREHRFTVLPHIPDTDVFMAYYSSCGFDYEEKFDLVKEMAVLNPGLLEKIVDERMLTLDKLTDRQIGKLFFLNPSLIQKIRSTA